MRFYKKIFLRLTSSFFIALYLISYNSHHVQEIVVRETRYEATLRNLKEVREAQRATPRSGIRKGYFRPLQAPSKCLTVMPSTEELVLEECRGDPSQLLSWHYSYDGEYADKLTSDFHDNKCIDAGKAQLIKEGKPLILYNCHGGQTQYFSYDYTAKIIYRVDDTRCFDYRFAVAGNSSDPRVAIQPCDLREEVQRWEFDMTSETFS